MNAIANFKDYIMNKKAVLAIIFLISLIVLLVLIKTNAIHAFDMTIYNMLISNMNESLTNFFKMITFLGGTSGISAFCLLALIIGIILKKGKMGFLIFGCTLVNWILNEVLKNIIQRPRPEILRLIPETSYSFPSGHTLASLSVCGILIYLILRSGLNRTIKIILTVLLTVFPILVGASRIYLGVHYASDVLGGILFALILLLMEIIIIEKKEFL